MDSMSKIGFGGGCHWCTEAVFLSLKGVHKVEQGFISAEGEHSSFSEAVIVTYNANRITMADLITIHLHTHKSTSQHMMRAKYRSAIYTFSVADRNQAKHIVQDRQVDFQEKLITKVLSFKAFEASDERFHNYYYSDPKKPFCTTHITPKLQVLMQKFSKHLQRA